MVGVGRRIGGYMKKKILMIIPKLVDGGAERVVSNLTLELGKDYEIDILLDYNCTGYPYKGNIISLVEQDIEPKGIEQWKLYLKKLFWLKKVKKERNYVAYISHSRMSNILNVLSGTKKQNVIVAMHCSITKPSKDNVKEKCIKRVEQYTLRRAPKVVAVSQGVAKELVELIGVKEENIYSIWNGSDIEYIQKLARHELDEIQKTWYSDSEYVVSAMGRYTFEKGHWHLIRALSKVVKRYPNIKLILLGDGKLKNYYENLIQELNLQNNIVLTGFQRNPFTLIAHSDLFAFPSISEGFPCSLVEAICSGVPCISADFKNGAREILGYDMKRERLEQRYEIMNYGIMVPVCSGKLYQASDELEEQEIILADSIMYMIEHREVAEKIVKNNKIRIHEFSIREMTEKWRRIIEVL